MYRGGAKVGHKGCKHSEETKQKISRTCKEKGIMPPVYKGMILSEERREKIRNIHLGKKLSEEHKLKISKALRGENGSNWKGGITPQYHIIRNSIKYRLWREKVFKRDNYTCQVCGAKSCAGIKVFLHPHHIKSFAEYPERRFWVSNGITLCDKCHRLTDNYLKAIRKIEQTEQINLFEQEVL